MFAFAPFRRIGETPSAYGVEETVGRLRECASACGWSVSVGRAIDEQLLARGQVDVGPVCLVEMCKPEFAAAILDNDAQKRFAVLMPCTFAVYRRSDGDV